MTGTMRHGTIAPRVAPRTADPAVVVLDAAGVIGRGLVAAALDAGHATVAVDRDLSALAALAAQHSQAPQAPLVAVPGSARDDADARELARALRTLGRPLSAVVAAVDAGRLRGRMLDQAVEASCAALQASLGPQLAAARHLLPLLAEGGLAGGHASGHGSFVLIGGPGGRHPWAGYGQRSVAEAALRMLARVLHDEARALGVRLQLLSVDTPTCGLHGGPPRAHWPSALQIGQRAMRLLEPGDDGGAVVEFALPPWPAAAHRTVGEVRGGEPPAESPPAPSPAAVPPQAADSDGAPLPSGCLQDARVLLRRLSGAKHETTERLSKRLSEHLPEHPPAPRNHHQETSPR